MTRRTQFGRRTQLGETASRTPRRETAVTEHPRNEERTADAHRGTETERGRERAARERLFQRSQPMPADRHE